jgi:flagellar hook-associated protein FlgK
MADMLGVAVSGLRAFQRALETTSHNIANGGQQHQPLQQ